MMRIDLPLDALDAVLPMSLLIEADGRISHVGPTLARARPRDELVGRGLFDVFQFRRPAQMTRMEDLRQVAATPLRLGFRAPPTTMMRGLAVPLGQQDGMLLSLSFGISITEAIRTYGLTASDFGATDQTLDMLYLIEAGSAAMAESRDLNRRLQGAKIAAEEQAFTDTLTGLKNRRALDHVMKRYAESDAGFSLLGVDLDYFKSVNDTLGHAAGDHVLQQAARIMVALTDPADTIVRSGGDEFLIVLKDTLECQQAVRVAERLIRRIEEPIAFENDTCRISASIGICSTAQYRQAWDLDQMLSDVDTALYVAKRSGRGRAACANDGRMIDASQTSARSAG